jgi:hypothetical protein
MVPKRWFLLLFSRSLIVATDSWRVVVQDAVSPLDDRDGRAAAVFAGSAPAREWVTTAGGAVVCAQREWYLVPEPVRGDNADDAGTSAARSLPDFTVLGICSDDWENWRTSLLIPGGSGRGGGGGMDALDLGGRAGTVVWSGSEAQASCLAQPSWMWSTPKSGITSSSTHSSGISTGPGLAGAASGAATDGGGDGPGVHVMHVASPAYCGNHVAGLQGGGCLGAGQSEKGGHRDTADWLPRFERMRHAAAPREAPHGSSGDGTNATGAVRKPCAGKDFATANASKPNDPPPDLAADLAADLAPDLTYGELTTEGLLRLASVLMWAPQDMIVDVGSGEVRAAMVLSTAWSCELPS